MVTDPNDWRPLTIGELITLTRNGISIPNVERVKIFHKSYRTLQIITLGHTTNQVIAPNGHVYIPPNQNRVPWSENYAVESYALEADFLHELVHVYQVRQFRKTALGMAKWRAENPNYEYSIVEGQLFEDYGIEQQATMVQDRYQLRMTGTHTYNNPSVTLQELEGVLPFVWAGP